MNATKTYRWICDDDTVDTGVVADPGAPDVARWRKAVADEICSKCRQPLVEGKIAVVLLTDGSVGHVRCQLDGAGRVLSGVRAPVRPEARP